MTRLNLPLDDGSYLALTGLASSGKFPEQARTLDAADFLRDAVLAGVSGNFSYDMLKAVAFQLRFRGFLSKQPQPSADVVAETATQCATAAGYQLVKVSRVEQLADKSWSVEGMADHEEFDARVAPCGQVMQLRFR